jgi:hypothetical protein
MPAKSEAQRRLFAIAEHHPSILYKANKNLANLPHQTLHDFAATKRKGLPQRKTKQQGPTAPLSHALRAR